MTAPYSATICQTQTKQPGDLFSITHCYSHKFVHSALLSRIIELFNSFNFFFKSLQWNAHGSL